MIRAALVCTCLLVSIAHGQPPQNIKTMIVTYALGGLPKGFKGFYKTGKEIKEFAANPSTLGDPIRYEGPRLFVLMENEAAFNAPGEGQQAPPPLAFVELPENADNVLIVAAPAAAGKIRLVAFDIATKNLGPGDYKVFNFSNSRLSVSITPQKFELAPGENKMIKDPSWHAKPIALPMTIHMASAGKAPTQVYSGFWEHFPSRRQVVFYFNGSRKSDPISIMCFPVEMPAEGKPEAAATQ